MVMDETTCMVRVGCVIAYFFRDESCGQCTQCREGTGWLHKIIAAHRARRGLDATTSTSCSTSPARWKAQTICAFADAAAWPVQGLLRHFREDFEAHVRERQVPLPARASSCRCRRITVDGVEIRGRRRPHPPAGARRPRPADERRRHPALLLAPEALDRRHLPAVSGRDRGHPEAPDRLQHARHGRHGGPHARASACKTRARRRDGAAARQPPARLPDLRPGRRVQAAGLRLRVRRAARRARRSRAAPREEARRSRPDDRVRPGALHPVPPLRALLPRGAGTGELGCSTAATTR